MRAPGVHVSELYTLLLKPQPFLQFDALTQATKQTRPQKSTSYCQFPGLMDVHVFLG